MAKMIGKVAARMGSCNYICCRDFNPKNKRDRQAGNQIIRKREKRELDRLLRFMVD